MADDPVRRRGRGRPRGRGRESDGAGDPRKHARTEDQTGLYTAALGTSVVPGPGDHGSHSEFLGTTEVATGNVLKDVAGNVNVHKAVGLRSTEIGTSPDAPLRRGRGRPRGSGRGRGSGRANFHSHTTTEHQNSSSFTAALGHDDGATGPRTPTSPPQWPPYVGLDLPDSDAVLSMDFHDRMDSGPSEVVVPAPPVTTETVSVGDVFSELVGPGEPASGSVLPPSSASDFAESDTATDAISVERGSAAADVKMPIAPILAPGAISGPVSKRRLLRSPVWAHFEKVVVRSGIATTKCKICKEELVYHNSTTSLDKHLLVKHRINVRSQDSAAAASSSSPALTRERTKPILSFIEEHSKQRMDSLHTSVQKFVILSEQPFSLVSEAAFQELIRDFDKKYRMMSPPTLVARLTRDYIEEKTDLKACLQSAQFVSLTTDLWTSTAGDPFAGITVHFPIGADLVARTLSCSLIPYPHKKEAIADVLFEAMEAFEISDKVVAISADGASNMRGAVPLLQQKVDDRKNDTAPTSRILSIWCLGHVINLTVQSAISSVKDVSDLLTKLRSWASFFRTHPKQMQALNEAQNLLKKPHCTPKGDTPTRWNSALAMLESTENLVNGFDIYLTTLESHAQESGNKDAQKAYEKIVSSRLSVSERELLRELKLLLDPFQQATSILSGSSYCTTSLIQPVISVIVDRLQALETVIKHPTARLLHASLLSISTSRFSDARSDIDFKVAVALDPNLCHRAEQVAIDHIKQLLQQTGLMTQATATRSESEPSLSKTGFDFMQALSVKNSNAPADMDEFTLFRHSCACAGSTKSPIVYWYENRRTFPRLFSIASRVFVMQATSVPCERLFSDAGNVISRKRASLSAENVEMVMFLLSAYRAKSKLPSPT